MNRKTRLSTSIICLLMTFVAMSQIKVVDSTNNSPIIGASVFNQAGSIIGITDSIGNLPKDAEKCEALTLRHVAYDALTTNIADIVDNTISLTPRVYTLDEINITNSAERNTMRIECFFRVFSSIDTGVEQENELTEGKMAYYLPIGKNGSSMPKILCFKNYIHNKNEQKDTFYTSKKENLNMLVCTNMLQLKTTPIIESKSFKSINRALPFDTIQGKYYPRYVYTNNGTTTSAQCDFISNEKNHIWSPFVFKMLGMTTDFDKFLYAETYRKTDNGQYTIEDLISASGVISFLGKGRLMKNYYGGNEARDDMYIEMFVTDISYLSKNDAKDMKKSDENYTGNCEAPASVPALDATALQLKTRALGQ